MHDTGSEERPQDRSVLTRQTKQNKTQPNKNQALIRLLSLTVGLGALASVPVNAQEAAGKQTATNHSATVAAESRSSATAPTQLQTITVEGMPASATEPVFGYTAKIRGSLFNCRFWQ